MRLIGGKTVVTRVGYGGEELDVVEFLRVRVSMWVEDSI